MFSMKRKISLAMLLALMAAASIQPQRASAQTPAAVGPEYADTRFKNRVFEIKYRDPENLRLVVTLLGSGFKGASLWANRDFKTITVRDFPENIVAIEEALKRLDTPQAAQADIELRLYVLLASNQEGGVQRYPAELSDVVKQLHTSLSYKDYRLVTVVIVRTKDGARSVHGNGSPEIEMSQVMPLRTVTYHYEYTIGSVSLDPASERLNLGNFSFGMNNLDRAIEGGSIDTAASLRDGEKVVVGTASLRDGALVLVLSAKVTR
jgi:hypothetical protein